MRRGLLAFALLLATAPVSAGEREYWTSPSGPNGAHARRFLVQVPRHPVKLLGKPAALYVNCSEDERAIALYAGDEPESLYARIRAVAASPKDSCEVRWLEPDGRQAAETWFFDRDSRLLVARNPAALYAHIVATSFWGIECPALKIKSDGRDFAPSHIEEGTSMEIAAMLDSMAAPRGPDGSFIDRLPEVTSKVAPVYPESARGAGTEGMVLIQVLVGTSGNVERLLLVQSIPDLDVAALDAVQKWKFLPAASNGTPVRVWTTVPVRFRLQ